MRSIEIAVYFKLPSFHQLNMTENWAMMVENYAIGSANSTTKAVPNFT